MPVSGVEYGRECYCAYSLTAGTALDAVGCTMTCAGDSSETCGGRSRLSVYNNTALSPPSAKSPILGSVYQGCFTDPSAAQRALQGYSMSVGTMTQELCISTCQSKGWKMSGVEFGRECYCSNEINLVANGGKSAQTSDGDCSMLCVADRTEFCGGSSRIGIWMNP